MKKINLILVLAIAFALFVCVSEVASATSLSPKYVGNTIVDLSWWQYWSSDFSKYVIYRDGNSIATIENRVVTFYRDSGLTKGVTYGYKINVYNSTGWLVDSGTTSAKTGDVHGTITRDTTWTATSSPYVQTGSVTVQKGVHFTIEPGVRVENSALSIYETLNVKSVSFSGFVEIYNSDDSSIQDCSFDGSGTDSCLLLESCNGTKIIGNTVSGSDGDGISIYRGDNNNISNNFVSSNGMDGIDLVDSSNNTIHNNIVSDNNGYGIELMGSSNSILSNNIASNNSNVDIYSEAGIVLFDSNNCILTNNIASNNDAGIFIGGGSSNILTNNNASNNWIGIWLADSSNNILTNNIANQNIRGIGLFWSSNYNTLISNTVNQNDDFGIGLETSSNNNILTDNTVNKTNDEGIYLGDSTSNTISNNSIYSNNEEGICLDNSTSNTISDNDIFDNDCGIGLWDLNNNNIISNNSIYSNNEEGIGLDNSASNTISDNNISDNDYGIGLWDSNNNLIYNNYFNNTNNAYDNGNNRWNTTKTAGTNIIGGPYLGGNYWSDYKGIDTDEDGLGDWLTPYSCSGEIENGGDYLPLSFLSLKPGDLLLCKSPGSIVPGFWTHVGMYIGEGEVVEALPKPGVTKTPIANWNYHYPDKTCVEALRVATTQDIRDKAVEFVKKQARENDSYYGLFWLTGRKHLDGNNWYCSELVWAAYKNQGVDIERYPDYVPLGDKGGILMGHNAVSPYEVHLSGNTYVIGEHKEKCPKRSFLFFFTKSPISLSVTDPDNFTINRELNEIPEAIYGCGDIDDDGDPDDWVSISEQKIGNYIITVIPEPDAAPTDTYTLEVSTEDTTIVLAENVSVSEIPTEPYIFESKAITFDTGSPANPYPSIFGTHNGTIKPNQTITVNKLYTYPCAGTGGHTEYARIWNSTLDVNATWNGYVGDWHNITFDEPFTLFAEKTYYYEVRTGSYPQIIHTDEWEAKGGRGIINCTLFVDANGKIYNDWIPAIRLE